MIARATIRCAEEMDFAAIRAVEIDTAPMFVEVGAHDPEEPHHFVTFDQMARCRANGLLFVADTNSLIVGFVAAEIADGGLYVAEIDVRRANQRQGLGRALLETLRAEAVRRGLLELTLTTDRNLPWNRPWYQRLGFEVIEANAERPALAAQLALEKGHHHPPDRRIAMRRALHPSMAGAA